MSIDLVDLRNQLVRQSERRVRSATQRMTDDLKRNAPVDTGELRRTTGAEVTSVTNRAINAEARIDVDYAEYVTKGTRPHVITPRKPGGVLAFKVGGMTVFATKVNHPGTKANDFFDRITNDWEGYLRRAG